MAKSRYQLVFKRSVAKDFRSIPNKDVARILRRIEALQQDPRATGSEKLSGQERYRLRQGAYRILYEVADEYVTVTIVKIAHRQKVYKRG